jgi:hypothetical protein
VKHQGLEFFGLMVVVSLMEAWQGRHWAVIAIWLTIGLFVLAMDWPSRHHHGGHSGRAAPR